MNEQALNETSESTIKENHMNTSTETSKSHLITHAEFEIQRVGLHDSDADYGGAIAVQVMKLIEVFDSQHHSGMSAGLTLTLFDKLARFQPLSPITSDVSEWTEMAKGIWQNVRRSTSFSRDGGQTWYDIEDESLNNGDVQ